MVDEKPPCTKLVAAKKRKAHLIQQETTNDDVQIVKGSTAAKLIKRELDATVFANQNVMVSKKVVDGMTVGCRPAAFRSFIEELTPNQVADVKRIGFGGLFECTLTENSTKIVPWLIASFNPISLVLDIAVNKEVMLSAEDIFDIFCIPRNEGRPVPEISRSRSSENTDKEMLAAFKSRLGLKCASDGTVTQKTVFEVVTNEDSGLKKGGDDFIRLFVLYVMSCFLTPTGNKTIDFRCLKALQKVEDIKHFDWCGFVLERLSDSVSRFKTSKSSESISACVLILQIFYFHRMKFRSSEGCKLPLIRYWTDEKLKNRIDLELAAGNFGLGLLEKEGKYPVCLRKNFKVGDQFVFNLSVSDDEHQVDEGSEKCSDAERINVNCEPKAKEQSAQVFSFGTEHFLSNAGIRSESSRFIVFELPDGFKTEDEINSETKDPIEAAGLILKRDIDVIHSFHMARLRSLKENQKSDNVTDIASSSQSPISSIDALLSDPDYLNYLDALIESVIAMKNISETFPPFVVQSGDGQPPKNSEAIPIFSVPNFETESQPDVSKGVFSEILQSTQLQETDTVPFDKQNTELLGDTANDTVLTDVQPLNVVLTDLPPPVPVREKNINQEVERREILVGVHSADVFQPSNKFSSDVHSSLGAIRFLNAEGDGRGCSLSSSDVDEKLDFKSKFMKDHRNLFKQASHLHLKVLDHCLNEALDEEEILVNYHGRYVTNRAEILCLQGSQNISGYVIDCWAMLLNEIQRVSVSNRVRFMFNLEHNKTLMELAESADDNCSSKLQEVWDSWLKVSHPDWDLSSIELIFVPVYTAGHYCCFVFNIDLQKIQFLDNKAHAKYDEYVKLGSVLAKEMSTFLKRHNVPHADAISEYSLINIDFDWKTKRKDSDVESGTYLLAHMDMFQGFNFKSNLSQVNTRRTLRANVCACLVLSDMNITRDDVLKAIDEQNADLKAAEKKPSTQKKVTFKLKNPNESVSKDEIKDAEKKKPSLEKKDAEQTSVHGRKAEQTSSPSGKNATETSRNARTLRSNSTNE